MFTDAERPFWITSCGSVPSNKPNQWQILAWDKRFAASDLSGLTPEGSLKI